MVMLLSGLLFLSAVAMVAVSLTSPADGQWHAWKSTHGKFYALSKEEAARRQIWLENSARIEEHNAGNHSFALGLNHFADMTQEEFHSYYLSSEDMKLDDDVTIKQYPEDVFLPDNLDWREKNLVTEVKNQGKCGDSWAFSAVGSLEGQFSKRTGSSRCLSVQQLIDCSWKYGTNGCNSGSPTAAFKYIIYNGLCLGSAYSYLGYVWKCMSPYCTAVVGINKYECISSGNEYYLQRALYDIGPISVSVDSNSYEFQFYSGGLYVDYSCSSSKLNHAMLLVGYGTTNSGLDYWLLKNSWSKSWGESGFMRIARNTNNMCGVATAPCYPYARLFS